MAVTDTPEQPQPVTADASSGRYTIRERTRRCASPKEGLRQVWDEVQVVEGRKVVARFDLVSQAQRWIEEQAQ